MDITFIAYEVQLLIDLLNRTINIERGRYERGKRDGHREEVLAERGARIIHLEIIRRKLLGEYQPPHQRQERGL